MLLFVDDVEKINRTSLMVKQLVIVIRLFNWSIKNIFLYHAFGVQCLCASTAEIVV